MNLPAKLSDLIFKTRFAPLNPNLRILEEMSIFGGGFELTFVEEGRFTVVGLRFKNTEDLLAFTLKYGKEYG